MIVWCLVYFILIAILLSKSKSMMQIAQSFLNWSIITRRLLMLWSSIPNDLAIDFANWARRVAPDTIVCCNDFGCLNVVIIVWCLVPHRCDGVNIQQKNESTICEQRKKIKMWIQPLTIAIRKTWLYHSTGLIWPCCLSQPPPWVGVHKNTKMDKLKKTKTPKK